ncbi:hypothetical protein GCM10027034_18130 [Ramlibacter solisilvae]
MNRQSEIASLYSNLRQKSVVVLIVLALSWIFVIWSLYISRKTGTDWFSRSGSIMGLAGAACTFRLSGVLQGSLVTALRHNLSTLSRELEIFLDPEGTYKLALYLSYLTGIVGTVIWGYGDKLLQLFFPS